tara:strand:+ start:239 stop:670 length:432 start_codon:yes stop_codon:yes gene_type:complete
MTVEAERKQKQREGSARYRLKHPNRIKEQQKRYNAKRKAASWQWNIDNYEKYVCRRAKASAKKRKLSFNLVPADIFVPEYCPVLGIKLNSNGPMMCRPSLDRIDNTIGYEPNNIIVVSWRANWLKSDATIEELSKIVHFYKEM